ncbi:hypothetical protein FOZ60_003198 [Perkinsus olseni]|uniref:Uncharacterized protein n=1 Tax=Perkinsus olseni TaxID=32597 RepID=A0A7J6NW34_PEROL|nr:hypothetical protein FOZ60_003198 [Perkinsus olseni]
MMSAMRLCIYLFGYLAATQLTDAVVRKEEEEIIGFMSPIKQINDNFIAERTVVVSDQLYGPILPDGSCPTIHGIKQVPSHVANVRGSITALPGDEGMPVFSTRYAGQPAKGKKHAHQLQPVANLTVLGTPDGTKETYSCHVDCFNKGALRLLLRQRGVAPLVVPLGALRARHSASFSMDGNP